MRGVVAFVSGLIFGTGLLLSGMTSPDRVLGFLDFAGKWDPSLAFVMGGGVLVVTPLFALARRRGFSLSGAPLGATSDAGIDRRLLAGAAIFGLGWGLAGLCPGPALIDLALSPVRALAFGVPMVIGLLLSRRV